MSREWMVTSEALELTAIEDRPVLEDTLNKLQREGWTIFQIFINANVGRVVAYRDKDNG